jgi:hypothetical protein
LWTRTVVPLAERVGEPANGVHRGEVRANERPIAARPLDLGDGCPAALARASDHHDGRIAVAESPCRDAPDTAGRAGHECDAIGEVLELGHAVSRRASGIGPPNR